jgi:tRNA nucleotidyltransferase/poly(A) polymerase
MAFDLRSREFAGPEGALGDLRARRLAPPRPGVLLEDPLRVLRAARFLAEIPGFRLARGAEPELRRAARRLGHVAGERRLSELDRIFSTPPPSSAKALRFLERAGALAVLLPRSTARERRRGLRLVRRMALPSPPVARALLLVPFGWAPAREILRKWKAPRREQQLARRLFAVAEAIGARPRSEPFLRREIVEVIRAAYPFLDEAALFLSAFAGARSRRAATAVRALRIDRTRLARILRPKRPIDVHEVATLLGVPPGPELGRALAELDLAIASGAVRSRGGALRLLAGSSRAGRRPAPR